MRFAGSRMDGVLGTERPDFGNSSQKAGKMQSAEKSAYNDMQGKVGAAGTGAAATAEAASITGAAQADAAQAQSNGQMFSTLGSVASAGIGAFGGGGASWNTGVSGNDVSQLSSAVKQKTMSNFGAYMASWF